MQVDRQKVPITSAVCLLTGIIPLHLIGRARLPSEADICFMEVLLNNSQLCGNPSFQLRKDLAAYRLDIFRTLVYDCIMIKLSSIAFSKSCI